MYNSLHDFLWGGEFFPDTVFRLWGHGGNIYQIRIYGKRPRNIFWQKVMQYITRFLFFSGIRMGGRAPGAPGAPGWGPRFTGPWALLGPLGPLFFWGPEGPGPIWGLSLFGALRALGPSGWGPEPLEVPLQDFVLFSLLEYGDRHGQGSRFLFWKSSS